MSATGRYLHQIEPQHSRLQDDPELPTLTFTREALVLVIMGRRFAGKTTVAALLADPSGPILITAPRGKLLSNLCERLQRQQSARGMQRLVIDADMSADELQRLLTLFVPRPVVAWLQVDDDVRWDRMKSRLTRDNIESADVSASETLNVCCDILTSSHARIIRLTNDETPDVAKAKLHGDLPLFWRR